MKFQFHSLVNCSEGLSLLTYRLNYSNWRGRGKWCAQRHFDHVSSYWWTWSTSLLVAAATLISSLSHPFCLFPHIFSYRKKTVLLLGAQLRHVRFMRAAALTSTHRFCWIIWRSHATQKRSHTAPNLMYSSMRAVWLINTRFDSNIRLYKWDSTHSLQSKRRQIPWWPETTCFSVFVCVVGVYVCVCV